MASLTPRFETLRWVAGVYFLILGTSLLLLPRGTIGWTAQGALRGSLSIVTGLVLLWLAGVALPRRVALALHVVAALPQVYVGVEALLAGNYSFLLILLALGILLAPFAASGSAGGFRHPDALGLILGAAQATQGLDGLIRGSAAFGLPPGIPLAASLIGSLLLVGGLAVISCNLCRVRRQPCAGERISCAPRPCWSCRWQ
ncbi:MAG: hypothetical protein HYX94_12815 [Chloroflexi bacterium]|nr:hypothetical protein [Chloroflexota bacterium]